MDCSIVIVDDHLLFAEALTEWLERSPGIKVLYAVKGGAQLQEKFKISRNVPDVLLLDLNLPEMSGFEIAEWMRTHHPEVHVIVVSMNHKREDVVRMIKAGAKGYLLKDSPPSELHRAITNVMTEGFYHSEFVSRHLVDMLRTPEPENPEIKYNLSDREREFLPLVCSDLTYREIAGEMCVSERTVDGYRESLFGKFEVKSRVGLVMFALREGLVEL